ncbi:MAG: hypothetical protein HYU29_03970 [Chloroflexi bacterium]|nr:hypothetical protein [Chloroflexota bacterium]
MALDWELGNPDRPRGHALLYFRGYGHPEKMCVTYIVVLPVQVDLMKYIPPFLSGQMAQMGATEFSAFAFPPAPEELKRGETPRHLAEIRDDDLLFGGEVNLSDVVDLLERVNGAVQEYAEAWHRFRERVPIAEESPEETAVDTVLYSLLGDRDKLNELAKLMSRIRYAAERGYAEALEEAEEGARKLGANLPGNYRVQELLTVARDPSAKGTRLAQLYLDRCYRLLEGDESAAERLEAEIRSVKATP